MTSSRAALIMAWNALGMLWVICFFVMIRFANGLGPPGMGTVVALAVVWWAIDWCWYQLLVFRYKLRPPTEYRLLELHPKSVSYWGAITLSERPNHGFAIANLRIAEDDISLLVGVYGKLVSIGLDSHESIQFQQIPLALKVSHSNPTIVTPIYFWSFSVDSLARELRSRGLDVS